MASRGKRAFQVHVDDGIPFFFGHICQHAVAQNAGIVNKHMQRAEVLHRLIDHVGRSVPAGHVVAIGDCFAAHGFDLGNNFLCWSQVSTHPITGSA